MKNNTQTLTAQLAEHFTARPGQWIDGMTLAGIAGQYAWRSRVSDLRRFHGMTIENKQEQVKAHAATCGAWDAGTVPCVCGLSRRYIKSSYRYVPAAAVAAA